MCELIWDAFRVIPVTAHAAFDKAGDYFGIRVKHVPVDPKTYQVDLRAMRNAISSNTCVVSPFETFYDPHSSMTQFRCLSS